MAAVRMMQFVWFESSATKASLILKVDEGIFIKKGGFPRPSRYRRIPLTGVITVLPFAPFCAVGLVT